MSHGKLHKKNIGEFAECELALLGTTCDRIEQLATRWIQKSSRNWTYIDGDHAHREAIAHHKLVIAEGDATFIHSGGVDRFAWNKWFAQQEGVLVNGHHFPAKQQVIIYDESKEQSLEKRRAQLTDVVAFYCEEYQPEVDSYFKRLFPDVYDPSRLLIGEKMWGEWLENSLVQIPPVEAIVLAGGRSTRMGVDKTEINYHGQAQTEYIAALCQQLGLATSISCREDQVEKYNQKGWTTIADRIIEIGPMGGIVSAFMKDPNKAYMVVASDMPLVNLDAIKRLLQDRNPSKLATCFLNEERNWPEPLFTLWEPKSYSQLLHFLSLGITCPRKVLMNSAIQTLIPEEPTILTNVNLPEEAEEMKKIVKK